MDDNCGEWVECIGVASGCGEQETGVASGSGWERNRFVWSWPDQNFSQTYFFLWIFRGPGA